MEYAVWDVDLSRVTFTSPTRPDLVRGATSDSIVSKDATAVCHVAFELLHRIHHRRLGPIHPPPPRSVAYPGHSTAFLPVPLLLMFLRWAKVSLVWSRVLQWVPTHEASVTVAEFTTAVASVFMDELQRDPSDHIISSVSPRFWCQATAVAALPEIEACALDPFLAAYLSPQVLRSLATFDDRLRDLHEALRTRRALTDPRTLLRVMVLLGGLDRVPAITVPATMGPLTTLSAFSEAAIYFCACFMPRDVLTDAATEILTACCLHEGTMYLSGRLSAVFALMDAEDSESALERSLERDLLCRRVHVYYQCVGKVSFGGITRQQFMRLMVDIGAAATVRDYCNSTPTRPSPTRGGLISSDRLQSLFEDHAPKGTLGYTGLCDVLRALSSHDPTEEARLLRNASAIGPQYDIHIDSAVASVIARHRPAVSRLTSLHQRDDIHAVVSALETAGIVPALLNGKDVLRVHLYSLTFTSLFTSLGVDGMDRMLFTDLISRLATLAFSRHPYAEVFPTQAQRADEFLGRLYPTTRV